MLPFSVVPLGSLLSPWEMRASQAAEHSQATVQSSTHNLALSEEGLWNLIWPMGQIQKSPTSHKFLGHHTNSGCGCNKKIGIAVLSTLLILFIYNSPLFFNQAAFSVASRPVMFVTSRDVLAFSILGEGNRKKHQILPSAGLKIVLPVVLFQFNMWVYLSHAWHHTMLGDGKKPCCSCPGRRRL